MEILLKQKRAKLKGNPPKIMVRNNQEMKEIKSAKNCFLLGGTLQNDITWQAQIETGEHAVLPKLRSKLGAIKHCCRKLPEKSRKLLITGLVISKMIYLLPIYGGTYRKYTKKLQVVLNNAARFVSGYGRRTSKDVLMRTCGWLDVEEMILYHSLLQMWRMIHLKVPLQVYKKMIVKEDLSIEEKHPRIQNTSFSYRYRTIPKWNELSEETRNIGNISKFKKVVKNWLIEGRNHDPGPVPDIMDG